MGLNPCDCPVLLRSRPANPAFEATIALAEATADELSSADVVPALRGQDSLLGHNVEDLLTQITATAFDTLYLLIDLDFPSTAPISSDAVLASLRFVAEVLGHNGIEAIWGATDGTGLLATTWSAHVSYALSANRS